MNRVCISFFAQYVSILQIICLVATDMNQTKSSHTGCITPTSYQHDSEHTIRTGTVYEKCTVLVHDSHTLLFYVSLRHNK